jgi:hypothetical protein
MFLGLFFSSQAQRHRYAGLLHSRMNFISLHCQGNTLELNPSIMFSTILRLDEILFWNGEPYHCLIVCISYGDMMMAGTAGFHYVQPGQGQVLADSDSFCKMHVEHQDGIQAFESFKALLLFVVPYLASQPIKTL